MAVITWKAWVHRLGWRTRVQYVWMHRGRAARASTMIFYLFFFPFNNLALYGSIWANTVWYGLKQALNRYDMGRNKCFKDEKKNPKLISNSPIVLLLVKVKFKVKLLMLKMMVLFDCLNTYGMFGNCFFSLFFVFKNNFYFWN